MKDKRRFLNIIKDRHFGIFKHNDDRAIYGYCLRLCEYKVFIVNEYGRIEMMSAIDDDYIDDGSMTLDSDIKPLTCQITLNLLEAFVKNEVEFNGFDVEDEEYKDEMKEDREWIYNIIRMMPDSPLITKPVRELLGMRDSNVQNVR